MSSTPLTAAQVLAMPLSELRERVDLAERLSIASRHTGSNVNGGAAPAATSAVTTTGVKPGSVTNDKNTPAPQAAASQTLSAASADDALGDFTSSAASGGDALGDFSSGGDDMLAGFVEELSPAQAKEKAVEIAKKIIGRKETSELAKAREVMQKYGVSKVSEVPEARAVELYNDFKAAFPAD